MKSSPLAKYEKTRRQPISIGSSRSLKGRRDIEKLKLNETLQGYPTSNSTITLQDIEVTEQTETPPTQKTDSNTKVYLGSEGKWGGRRRPITARMDDNLYKAFKTRVKALGSSVCSEFEAFMIAYLGYTDRIVKGEVHFGNTFHLDQTVYRNLSRDRRVVNPAIVEDRPVVFVPVKDYYEFAKRVKVKDQGVWFEGAYVRFASEREGGDRHSLLLNRAQCVRYYNEREGVL